MKIFISDICGDCCPDKLGAAAEDAAAAERIRGRVYDNLGMTQPKRMRKSVRTLLLAAAAAALLSTAAYAAIRYGMNGEQVDSAVSSHWTELGENGKLISDQELNFPDAGMVFTFSGPEESRKSPEFRAFWLPGEASCGYTDADGWTEYLSDDGEGNSIPYVISVESVNTDGRRYVLSGRPAVVKEEYWGELYILEISCDYSGTPLCYENDTANYILMFDESRGCLARISGTSDMATLEHIARELELRESGQPPHEYGSLQAAVCAIDLGRG